MFRRSTLVLLTVLIAAGVFSAAAAAETPGPGWEITSTNYPTNLAPSGGTGAIDLNVYNVGAAPSSGPVTVTDVLPEGVVATQAGDLQEEVINQFGFWDCTTGHIVTCTNNPERLPSLPIPITYPEEDLSDKGSGAIERIGIAVKVTTSTPGTLENRATVSGGGAPDSASTTDPIDISSTPPAFGFRGADGWASNENGTLDTQAGSHPYEVFFTFDLNTVVNEEKQFLTPAGGEPRDLSVNVPAGLVGNPTAVPECPRQIFEEEDCPAPTQVGVDEGLAPVGATPFAPGYLAFPVYNLVPPPGVPALFALDLFSAQIFLEAGVRSGGDYGITVHADNLPQKFIMGNRIILWGEPASPLHDEDRSEKSETTTCGRGGCVSNAPRVPFLTLATSCRGPETFSITADTWETAGFAEASFLTHDAGLDPSGLSGCDHLGFSPSVSVAPDTSDADTPAGLTVDVHVPQEGLVESEGLATSNIKDTTVVLPAGVVINPGQAAGLQACTRSEGALEPLPGGKENDGPAVCPNASKVGTVQIATPLLKTDLDGSVYVLQSNPPHLKLLVAATGEGVNLKLVGDAELCETAGQVINGKTCEAPGQLITTFSETPELPFTDFKLSFSGGAQAALDTPTQCGTYTTTSDFTPWSAPAVGHAFPTSNFVINAGPGGSPCPGGTLGFSPFMVAGATSDKAGAFTNFSMLLQRGDDQQRIEKLAFKQPAGLGGVIAGVALCGEPQASQGTCSTASQIGHAVVASGPGPYPLVLPQPGAPELPIYLTGPYKGAPFGLSIVTPVVAGPFNLGTIVTRAKVEVDPKTVQISIVTDPLPQEVDGVPTDLRSIDSVIDRPGFIYNPSNCDPQEFTGAATSTQGDVAPLTSHFGMGSCRELEFHPKISGATRAHASKADGAELHFDISYPKAPHGTQSWLKEFKLDLPKQLPSRLTTIQKACPAATFETNRGACPVASIIGHATVHTPVLPVPLEGPMYDVSYGGAKFPDVVLVLKGDGVTLEEVGEVFIKNGITSTTFKAIPDAPFESVEVTLPAGPHSQFAAYLPHNKFDFCGQDLKMPTAFVAQNGLEIHQSTPIGVSGCPKAHKASKHHKKAQRAGKRQQAKKSSGHFTSIAFGALDRILQSL